MLLFLCGFVAVYVHSVECICIWISLFNGCHPQQRKNMRPLELLVTAGLLREGERLHYRSKDGEIKLYGTLQCVGWHCAASVTSR